MKTKILTGIIYIVGVGVVGLATKVVFFENMTQQVQAQSNSSVEATQIQTSPLQQCSTVKV